MNYPVIIMFALAWVIGVWILIMARKEAKELGKKNKKN